MSSILYKMAWIGSRSFVYNRWTHSNRSVAMNDDKINKTFESIERSCCGPPKAHQWLQRECHQIHNTATRDYTAPSPTSVVKATTMVEPGTTKAPRSNDDIKECMEKPKQAHASDKDSGSWKRKGRSKGTKVVVQDSRSKHWNQGATIVKQRSERNCISDGIQRFFVLDPDAQQETEAPYQ